MLSSFETVEAKVNGQQNLFTIVVVILHLSNIDFAPAHVDSVEGSQIQSRKGRQSLDIVVRLLRV